MDCCQCRGIESIFNKKMAQSQLKHYRKSGPDKTTRILIDAVEAEGVRGATLLDIGGGIGAIQHALLADGAASATDVDASTAYLAAAKEEAQRLGFGERMTYRHGDFVALASDVAAADIVTLDRVVCCYHDMRGLVSNSAAKARRIYALVYPRDTWWLRQAQKVGNLLLRLSPNPFRFFVHSSSAVDAIVRDAGFERYFHRPGFLWQVVAYRRPEARVAG